MSDVKTTREIFVTNRTCETATKSWRKLLGDNSVLEQKNKLATANLSSIVVVRTAVVLRCVNKAQRPRERLVRVG